MRIVFEALLRLFPRGFREQFGEDMLDQMEHDLGKARAEGFLHGLAFSASTNLDLLRSAAAEHLNPTWVDTSESITMNDGMWMMMGRWTKDLALALRALRRAPGFSVVTVVTLALAIGANAGIFSVVDAVLLKPLPFAEPDRLVAVAASAPGSDFPDEFGVSTEFYVHFGERSETLESFALYNDFTNTMRVGDRAERVRMAVATPSLFTTLGVTPILGRAFVDEDEGGTAVISHKTWTQWFGNDPGVIGRTEFIAGETRTIVGVMGPDFWFPSDDLMAIIPWVVRPANITPGRFGNSMVARMSATATPEAAVAELTELAREIPERFGGSPEYASFIEQHRSVVHSLESELVGEVSGPLWVLLVSVGIVLLIACANVANLFLVRAEHRHQDLAVRRALGAARSDLIRTQIAEAVVVAGFAGLMAIGLAAASVPLYLKAAPQGVPRLADVGLSSGTLLFTFGVATFAALACGLLPAIRASMPNLTRLRESGRGSTSRRHWARNVLVVGQTALALVLLIGSALLVRSFVALRGVDPGYETADVFTFQFAPERADLVDGPTWVAFHHDFLDQLAARPDVEMAGIVENVPLNEGTGSGRFVTEATAGSEDGGALVAQTFAGGDYFAVMGISVLQGRPFQRADHISDFGNVVVSEATADLLWPGESPVGQRIAPLGTEEWATVVGVVEDVLQYGYRDDPQPMIYLPMRAQDPNAYWLSSPGYVVKTERADVIAPEIREMIREIAPGAPMYRIFTMAELERESMLPLSFTMLTLGLASGLALILGAIGLFGVLSYVVSQRTREIGLRMALGAEADTVTRMVVVQGARVVLAGVVLGTAAAAFGTRFLDSMLFGVEAVDLGSFAAMAGTMVAVGLLASYLPARRAANVDPIESLKEG